MNENPSVRIESAGSKTSNNCPLRNGSVVSNFSFGNLSSFTRAIMLSNQYGGSLVWQKFLNNALTPDGALALFEIFAGRISCNKRPHNRYLLLQ